MAQVASLLAKWVVYSALVGMLCGCASSVFLWLLDVATDTRNANELLVYALPLGGLLIGWGYERFGATVRAGNNLVIDRMADGGAQIPPRMAPMVLLGTVLTHVFGGSAGREGTAVQMGASLADWVSHRLHLSPQLRQALLTAGVAGGFGSVFGTPLAGTVFALELVVLGRLHYRLVIPAAVAAFVGDATTHRIGISIGVTHTPYPTVSSLAISPLLVGKWLVFAAAVALITIVFIELTHAIKRHGERFIPRLPVRMFVGGVVIVALWRLVGTSDYLGLGVPTIVRAFDDPTLASHAFALKVLFTAITIGMGFIGGEVTPLFFIGATLGGALAGPLELPLAMAAGVGLAAVFATASNTPIALTLMAIELLGINVFPHAAIVCAAAYFLSGHRSIYPAQRVVCLKWGKPLATVTALRDLPRSKH